MFRYVNSLRVAKWWSSNSTTSFTFISWKILIMRSFFSTTFCYSVVMFIKERENKCLIISIYLAVFKMMNLPTPRLTNLFLKYHYKLIFLKHIWYVSPFQSLLSCKLHLTYLWPERASSNCFLSSFETSFIVSSFFLVIWYDRMFQAHLDYFLPHTWNQPFLKKFDFFKWRKGFQQHHLGTSDACWESPAMGHKETMWLKLPIEI